MNKLIFYISTLMLMTGCNAIIEPEINSNRKAESKILFNGKEVDYLKSDCEWILDYDNDGIMDTLIIREIRLL